SVVRKVCSVKPANNRRNGCSGFGDHMTSASFRSRDNPAFPGRASVHILAQARNRSNPTDATPAVSSVSNTRNLYAPMQQKRHMNSCSWAGWLSEGGSTAAKRVAGGRCAGGPRLGCRGLVLLDVLQPGLPGIVARLAILVGTVGDVVTHQQAAVG